MLKKFVLSLLTLQIALFALSVVALASPLAPVPKTGQTIVYHAGDDGDTRRGVNWPSPRFKDNDNGTVTDNLTDLVWLKNAKCIDPAGGIVKTNGSLSWINAISWSNALTSGKCGLRDGSISGQWRLPTIRELNSILDRSNYSPALPSRHPFVSVQLGNYWTSTTSAGSEGYAWLVIAPVIKPSNQAAYAIL